MSETKVQAKILKWLKSNDFYVFKTILCNRNGIPDVIGCTPKGRFFAIEVKFGSNKASKLQEYNIEQIKAVGGIAFVAYDLETVKQHLTDK